METGINPRLLDVVNAINIYCVKNGVQYDIACDESDLQGIKLFQKNQRFVSGLLNHIQPFIEANSVHLETQNVRGGTILALSLKAISEQQIQKIIKAIGEQIEPLSFRDRMELAVTRKPLSIVSKREAFPAITFKTLEETAKKIVGKDDDKAKSTESNEVGSTSKVKTGPTGVSKGSVINFESRIAQSFGLDNKRNNKDFNSNLDRVLVHLENMDGMATSLQTDPDKLFRQFAQALKVLGQQMGIGPLQDQLKKQGIRWKKSDDGMSVTLYIINASTNAPQPVARISAETLDKPNEFEKTLKDILDFSKGEAPGAFQQKQEAMRNQEKAIRDIAKSVSPQEQEELQQQQLMMQGELGDAEMTGSLDKSSLMDAAKRAASLK
jgi:hypothetical protein